MTTQLSLDNIKRNKTQIFIDVLRAVKEGSRKPTRIMYRSNLSWRPLKSVLQELVTLGLVERKIVNPPGGSRKRSTYLITESGMKILRRANDLEKEFMYVFLNSSKAGT